MKNFKSNRRLRLESLEERTLLAVTAGLAEPAAALAAPTGATNWVVNTTDDPSTWDKADDIFSLREAIGRAQAGDSITFDESLADSVITLSGSQLKITKSITIDASSIGGITVDAVGRSRVFSVSGGTADAPVELISLTITGGDADVSDSNDGGGIYNTGTLTLTNCTVSGNSSDNDGGGIYNSGTLTLTGCTVSENSANCDYYDGTGVYGGGIYNSGTLTLTSCTVSENSANCDYYDGTSGHGGGIYNSGTLTLTSCTVSENSANGDYDDDYSGSGGYGGGIYNWGTLTLTSCTVSGNSSSDDGGAFYNYGSSAVLTLTNCTVTGNRSSDYGGAFYNTGTLTLTNCTVTGNNSSDDGGAFYNYGYSAVLTLTSCTVAGNTAYYGGGIYNSYNGTSYLYNTIIAQNTASSSDNDVSRYYGSLYAYNSLSSFTDWDESENCLTYDPSQPLFKDEVGGDYTLTENSQAIDKGNNGYLLGIVADIVGNPRIVDGIVDLGAYESQNGEVTELEVPSTIVTTKLDVADPTDNLISLREAIYYAATDDAITFDASLSGQTITLGGNELVIDKTVSIDASSIGGITVDADGKSRVFNVSGGTADVPVELIALTITGGNANVSGSDDGGGIYNKGRLKLTNCTVTGNRSSDYGGAFYNYGSSAVLTMTNCTVTGNRSSDYGGAFYNTGTLTLTNCTVAGNTGYYGGGIYIYSGTLTLRNSTVAGNSGGGICNNYGTSYLYNTIIAQNTASSSGNDVSRYYGSLYAYNTLSSFTGWTESENCLTYDPSHPLFKDEVGGDYTLTAGSLAINHGNNDYISGYETDLAGNPRIFDGTVDIGAYEHQTVDVLETPSTVVTTNLDVVDFTDNLISLREAIDYAEAGDTITFETSLSGQTITLGGKELVISKTVSIDASSIGGITVDAAGKSRVFNVSGGTADVPVELIGLTITGGSGGGIRNSGDLTLINCSVSGNGNTASSGGGIYNYGSSAVLTLTNCTVSGNTVRYGNCGGIFNQGTLTLTNCTVSGNTAGNYCGGIWNDDGTLTLTSCTVSGNTAGNCGGIYNSGTLTLTNCTVSGNTAGNGGGIYNSSSSASAYLYNTIITQNTPRRSGNDVYRDSGSLYAYNTLSSFTGWTESENCPTYDPSFPLFTDAAGGDYTLVAGSLAINHGNNDYISGYETDLAGNPRIFDGTVDIGAYEHQTVDVLETPSTVVTTNLDVVDFADNLISLREAIFYAATGDVVTFDASLSGQTITLGGKELVIDKAVSIDASSIGGITVDANGKSRVFNVSGGTADMPVELIALKITGGNANVSGSDDGGAVYNTGTLTLTNCAVTGNNSGDGGGAFYNYGSSAVLTLTNCTVSGNTASASWGGGIYIYSGTLTMTNCTVSGNTAYSGGGIYNSGALTLTNCTVSGNSSGDNGGGIYNSYNSTSYLYNTIIAQNTASSSGNDVYRSSGSLYAYNTLSSFTDWTESENCLIYASSLPLFKDAANGDYTLAAGSLAINHGNNDYISGYETDLAGNPRIFEGTVDIGAYEHQTVDVLETPSTVVTTNLDVVDFADNLISLREAIFYAATGDTITFETSLSGQTITLGGNELVIDKTVSIDASSIGGITVDANGKSRVFNVSGGTADVPVELIALTITGGYANVSDSNDGGGIYNTGILTLTNCTVSGNSSSDVVSGSGGGIYNDDGTLTLLDCTVSGNTASYEGGGIDNSQGTLMMTNCTVAENSANGYYDDYIGGSGGAIYNSGTLTLTSCTVAENSANGHYDDDNSDSGGYGGGIYNSYGSTSFLYNTIIAQNTASSSGNDVYRSSGSLYAYNTLSSFTGWASGSSNNLTYDPSQPLFTDAAGGDYTLAANSQAIDKGNNAYVDTETDLAGNPRIAGGIVDLGAYEYQSGGGQTEQLAAPEISTGSRGVYVSCGANRHQIQWSAVANASGYELQYSADGSRWTAVSAAGTAAVVTGLTYGQDVQYRVRALGTGSYTDSDWSGIKTFNVCPMDVNGDGDVGGLDRNVLAVSWGAEEGDGEYQFYADINADGDVGGLDRNFLGSNWGAEAGDGDLTYPKPAAATDAAFAAYGSGGLDIDLNIF